MSRPASASTRFLILVVILLFAFTLTCASRAGPSLLKHQGYRFRDAAASQVEDNAVVITDDDETSSCEEVGDPQKCLMRRTLAAHLDYIYTQKEKP